MNRYISLFFIILIFLTGSQAFEGGSGTSSDPYLIGNCFQFQDISNDLSAYYELSSDIDCEGDSFTPIGTDSNPFRGSLDGSSHSIKNVEIQETFTVGLGIFGQVNGDISDLIVENVDVSASNNNNDAGVGGLAGVNQGTITRVGITGKVSGQYNVGGLVGYNRGGVIQRSYSTVYTSGDEDVGALVGENGVNTDTGRGAEVTNSYAVGTSLGNTNVGGLVGNNQGSTISQVFGASRINEPNSNGIFGENNRGTVEKASWDFNVSGSEDLSANYLYTQQAVGSDAETNMALDFSNVWTTTYNTYPRLQWQDTGTGGTLTPYQIYNCRDLQNIGRDIISGADSEAYQLAYDIRCSDTNNWNSDSTSGYGFIPIGGDHADREIGSVSEFNGGLYGLGHEVKGIEFNWEGSNLGLFRQIGASGTVDGMRLRNFNITASGFEPRRIGGVAGRNYGEIIDSKTIDSDISNEFSYSGGISGGNGGIMKTSSSLQNNIRSVNSAAGGLTGSSSTTSQITASYSDSSVNVDTGDSGGLIGSSSGFLNSSYTEGSVGSTGTNVGGLIGSIPSSSDVKGNVLSRTDVPLSNDANAFIGDNSAGNIIENGYWDFNQSSVTGSNGESLYTEELTGESAICNLEGFDFQIQWVVNSGSTPVLNWQTSSDGIDPSSVVCPGDIQAPVVNFPLNNSEDVRIDTNLSVTAQGKTGVSQDISFYGSNSTSSPELIQTFENLESGDVVEANWSFRDYDTEYIWYAEASNSVETVKSPDWNFTSEQRPQVLSESPAHQSLVPPETDLEVEVFDDRSNDIDVRFYDSNDQLLGENLSQASGTTPSVDPGAFGETPNQEYRWYVVLETDSGARVNTSESMSYPDYFRFETQQTIDAEIEALSGDQENLNNGSADFGTTQIRTELNLSDGATADNFNISVEGTEINSISGAEDQRVLSANISGLVNQDRDDVDWTAEVWNNGNRLDRFEGNFSTYTLDLTVEPEGSADQAYFYHSYSSGPIENYDLIGSGELTGSQQVFTTANRELRSGNNCFRSAAGIEGLIGPSIERCETVP